MHVLRLSWVARSRSARSQNSYGFQEIFIGQKGSLEGVVSAAQLGVLEAIFMQHIGLISWWELLPKSNGAVFAEVRRWLESLGQRVTVLVVILGRTSIN